MHACCGTPETAVRAELESGWHSAVRRSEGDEGGRSKRWIAGRSETHKTLIKSIPAGRADESPKRLPRRVDAVTTDAELDVRCLCILLHFGDCVLRVLGFSDRV